MGGEMEVMVYSLPFATLPTDVASNVVREPVPDVIRDEQSDDRLIERIAAGDRLAMEVLYGRHRVRVYRFVLRLVKNTASAEDITSDVFLHVWRQADRFEGRSQVSTWMLSIARHRGMSALRSRTNDCLDHEMVAAIPDSTDNAEVTLQKQHTAALLRRSLEQLSPAHREIIDLAYYHEKSIAEVAEITGVPQNTVKTRMFHARKRLAELLDSQGFNSAA
jgi:RNA polymerase sigma-70 factor (ECF subfamily)